MVTWWMITLLPKRTITIFVGCLARCRISRWGIRWYARHYDIDRTILDRPLQEFRSLGEFFARPLKEGARPIADADLICPVDGRVYQMGSITRGQVVQVKDLTYALAALLADDQAAQGLEGGQYFVLYLAPRDYHRIHAPTGGTITGATYIPGSLWPVNDLSVAHRAHLFPRNERITMVLQPPDRPALWMVMVGATIVGMTRFAHDPQLTTRKRGTQRAITHCAYAQPVAQGDLVAWFEMGSTVIVIAGPGVLEPLVHTGDFVQMGQPLARWAVPVPG
jgi:phosphatidylserine decarboxylase